MNTLLRPALVLLILSIATPTAHPQSGGGANIGGAANTAEGTGRGAGGPGDGEGPGQGAGQGLGPGGRDKTDREKSKQEKAEKEKQGRQRREKEKRERTEKEKQDRERSEREKVDQEKQNREQREKEDREKEDREKADKERQNREREEEDEERKNNEREKPEKENPPREDGEKDGEERNRPGDNQPESRGDETGPREDKPADGKPAEPAPPTSPEDKEKGNPQPTDPKAEETAPPTPQPGPRDLPVAPTDPKPALDRSSVDPLIPGSDKIPGTRQLGENVQSLTDPSSAVDRFFGFFTGGGKRRAVAEPAAVVSRSGKNVVTVERPAGARRARGAFLGIFRLEFPNLVQATRVRDVAVDSRVTSPRTVTYKSRLSRVSRWIGPLTLGLLNYVPFETMNAAVAGRINNLMAEEEISVEQLVARTFEDGIRKNNRYVIAETPEAVFELEMTRYALDPMPTSLGRVKPTVSVTGRLYDTNGQLLWLGKGFSTIAEPGLKGANVEHYEANPAQLRADFETAARVAMSRLVAQANAVPKATVKVSAAE